MARQTNNKNTLWIIGIIIIGCLFGLIMVASSSQIIAFSTYKDTFYFFKRQLAFLFIGAILCFVFSQIDYKKIPKWTPILFVVSIVLLIIVLIPGIGHSAHGSSRWIPLGFFNLQPSEVAKFTAILLIATIVSKKSKFKKLDDYKPFVLILVLASLVFVQPDFGTAVLIVATGLITLLACGVPWRQFFAFLLSFSALGVIAIFSAGYRRQRFLAFLDPWADYRGSGFQIIQSLLALGSGGVNGVGLSLSKQKFSFLPAAYTDFIFAVIGEELGFLGAIGTVLFFAALTVVGFGIASSCKNPFGKALASAITISIIIQAGINIGACIGIFPITGIPLPLISYGGSSLLMTLAALGILVNISKQNLLKGA